MIGWLTPAPPDRLRRGYVAAFWPRSVCVNPKRAHLIIENATTLGLFSLDVIIQNAST